MRTCVHVCVWGCVWAKSADTLITSCLSSEAGAGAVSDMRLAAVSQETLERDSHVHLTSVVFRFILFLWLIS